MLLMVNLEYIAHSDGASHVLMVVYIQLFIVQHTSIVVVTAGVSKLIPLRIARICSQRVSMDHATADRSWGCSVEVTKLAIFVIIVIMIAHLQLDTCHFYIVILAWIKLGRV